MAEAGGIIEKLIVFVAILIGAWIVNRIKGYIFKKIYNNYQGLHLKFLEKICTAIIITAGVILAVSTFWGLQSFWKTALGGTAFASAMLIFTAQDTIKDVLAGIRIVFFKPFEIGNRIELEDGTAGIIKDISMQYVVLALLDTQTLLVPNSKMIEMQIKNFSYHDENRSISVRVNIAYNSDVEKAISVIRQAIMESTYTIPGKLTDKGLDYAPVYFLAYDEYSLRLETTVYYTPANSTEAVKTDVNLRINKALKENGIEVPYKYINIMTKE